MKNSILQIGSLSDDGAVPELRRFLERHLFDEIISFWERVGSDPDGGFNTCRAA